MLINYINILLYKGGGNLVAWIIIPLVMLAACVVLVCVCLSDNDGDRNRNGAFGPHARVVQSRPVAALHIPVLNWLDFICFIGIFILD